MNLNDVGQVEVLDAVSASNRFSGSPPTSPLSCALVNGVTGGLLTSDLCQSRHPYVCSRTPLDVRPDNPCPKDFYAYKDSCLRPERNLLKNYADAKVCQPNPDITSGLIKQNQL